MIELIAKEAALEVLTSLVRRRAPLREVAIAYVQYVLACHGGNKAHAANEMGIDRRTIQRWLPGGGRPGRRRREHGA